MDESIRIGDLSAAIIVPNRQSLICIDTSDRGRLDSSISKNHSDV